MKCNPAVATIAIDLAKSVFQVLAVDQDGRAIDSHRLSRAQFIAFWQNRAPVRVVMVDWALVNAFATPGGQIIMTRGLVQKAASPDEVIARLQEQGYLTGEERLYALPQSTDLAA